MPTYDYRCKACNHEMAKFQRITEDALVDCPECGKPELRRLIGSGAGIIFKGSGFYETDYKRARNGGDSKKSQSKTESKSETKSDSKSDSSSSSDSKK